MTDLTEQPRVEQELREFADRMSAAERIAGFGVWRWELTTGVMRWSDELQRIHGLEPGDFPGSLQGFLAHVHPEDREGVWAAIERAVGLLEPFVFEARIVRVDGDERILLFQGVVHPGPDGAAADLVAVCHDVTERVDAKRALGMSERRMRAIIDNSPSIIAVKDLDGRYLMTNAETTRFLGVAAEDIVGRLCGELFPTISEQLRANDRRATAEREPVFDEAVLIRDGEPRTFATVTFALPDEAGLPVETCTIGTDVTELAARADAGAGRGGGAAAGRLPAGGRALRHDPVDRHLDGAPGAEPVLAARARDQPVGCHAVRSDRAAGDRCALASRAGGGAAARVRDHRDGRCESSAGRERVRRRADGAGLRPGPSTTSARALAPSPTCACCRCAI